MPLKWASHLRRRQESPSQCSKKRPSFPTFLSTHSPFLHSSVLLSFGAPELLSRPAPGVTSPAWTEEKLRLCAPYTPTSQPYMCEPLCVAARRDSGPRAEKPGWSSRLVAMPRKQGEGGAPTPKRRRARAPEQRRRLIISIPFFWFPAPGDPSMGPSARGSVGPSARGPLNGCFLGGFPRAFTEPLFSCRRGRGTPGGWSAYFSVHLRYY